ncbi:putative disease resistance protein RGA3 [Bienertia sinuspersici]
MDVGTVMSVVQTLLASLECSELKQLCSIFGYETQLSNLEDTVNVIKAVLVDAEQKQVFSNQEQLYIENLKDVVDEADNLFDEFVTLAERKKLSEGSNKARLLSVFSKYGLAYKMSQKAKKMKEKLDKIAYNKQFSFKHNPVPIHKLSRETCSYEQEQIIGREDDLEAVKSMLLEPPNAEKDISFLSIVGIGGLGKTALAQQVYNDPQIMGAFSLRMWTCVSDESHKQLIVKDILCKMLRQIKQDLDKDVRHLSLVRSRDPKLCFTSKNHVRSYLQLGDEWFSVGSCVHELLANWKYLRMLDLSHLDIKILPESIGKLLHLRYLDVSENAGLEVLPRQITKLHNLLVLKLRQCYSLKLLPKDMSKLGKLRVLDNTSCLKLTYMPRGIGELTCLHKLSEFVVGEASSSKELFDGLQELKGLVNLKGELRIKLRFCEKDAKIEKSIGREEGYLMNSEHVDSLTFEFCKENLGEAVMEELQPHHNLKKLEMWRYKGTCMPRWAMGDNLAALLPNLVHVKLESCTEVKHLGRLWMLRHLESLELDHLPNLEYVNVKATSVAGTAPSSVVVGVSSSSVQELSFFPSLKELKLRDMPKMKGWEADNDELQCLPQLKTLHIFKCPSLTVILQCPLLEVLWLTNINRKLHIIKRRVMNKGMEVNFPKLKDVCISRVDWLKELTVTTNKDREVESLGAVGEVFCISSSSIEALAIECCENLKSVSGGMEHLTTLIIRYCPNLSLSGERTEGSNMAWLSLRHSLCLLQLEFLPQLVSLPNWIQYLTALQILKIMDCKELESLPNWMSKLTSLKELRVQYCSQTVVKRCQDPTGQDWPHIAHIPSLYI